MKETLNVLQIYHPGLFTENSLILVEGVYYDGILQVHGLAMPPPESSRISRYVVNVKLLKFSFKCRCKMYLFLRAYFGNADTFAGLSDTSLKSSTRLLKIEKENEEAMLVFLADIWLDKSEVSICLKYILAFLY
jgi:DNA polymerase epsilon subunit 2